MERKIKSCMKEKGLMDSTDIVMEPLFTDEIMAYPNSRKLKPPSIDLCHRTKDPVDNIQTFQFHMHYMGAQNAILYYTFLTTFCLAIWDWYITLKPNSIESFREFAHNFILYFTFS